MQKSRSREKKKEKKKKKTERNDMIPEFYIFVDKEFFSLGVFFILSFQLFDLIIPNTGFSKKNNTIHVLSKIKYNWKVYS